MAKKLEESPLGWTVVLLFIVLNAAEVLTYDIDDQLEARFGSGNGFDPQKKYWLKNYYRCMKQARHWLEEMFKIDDIVWDRVMTKNHGIGILDLNTNDDNWIINLESGGQTVLNTKQFSII